MTNLRFQVVEEAFKKKPLEVMVPLERPSEYFGKYVFNRAKMYKYLPADVYDKLIDVIDNGSRLDRSIADAVAAGMKQWPRRTALHTTLTGFSRLQALRRKSMTALFLLLQQEE